MAADLNRPWLGATEPFKIYGNVYFVGTGPASSHLIDTGDGLILLDPGYPESLYLVIDSIHRMGFSTKDIRILLHSHGHYDHIGATRAMVELTGAETWLGAEDVPYAEGRETPETLTPMDSYAFTPDHILEDGGTISLGNTTIRCVHTPGHTMGTYSFFFDAYGEEGPLRCGMFGGVGFNTMRRSYLDPNCLDNSCRQMFLASVERMKQEHVDIFLGNHIGNNDTLGKGAAVLAGEGNPFLHTGGEWKNFLAWLEQRMHNLIRSEEV